MNFRRLTVIAGGQTGVDQAALEAAFLHGIKTGGYVPKGYLTERGSEPTLLKKYGLIEHASHKYGPRTAANVNLADGIVIIGRTSSPGTSLTQQLAKKSGKPMLVNPRTSAEIRHFIQGHKIRVLMVAGNRLSTGPEYAEQCAKLFTDLFSSTKQSAAEIAARRAFDAAFLAGFQSTDSEWNGEVDEDGDIVSDSRFRAQRDHAWEAYLGGE